MKPPMAMVSPSRTVTCVLKDRVENDGESIVLLVFALAGCGWLTVWSMIMVTMPLELTRAVIESVVPVVWLETELKELPVTATPDDVSTGTLCPTFMTAGTLSVAMILGAAITLD